MATKTIAQLTGKTAVATDELEVQATGGGASNKVTASSLAAATFIGASAVNSAVQVIATATDTPLTFDSEVSPRFDTSGIHSTSSNTSRFTVPVGGAGKWMGTCGYGIANNSTALRYAYWRINGTTQVPGSMVVMSGIAASFAQQCTMPPTVLADGDYVECVVLQTSGSNINYGSNSLDSTSATLSFWRLSP